MLADNTADVSAATRETAGAVIISFIDNCGFAPCRSIPLLHAGWVKSRSTDARNRAGKLQGNAINEKVIRQ
jgi:hypothetical protein